MTQMIDYEFGALHHPQMDTMGTKDHHKQRADRYSMNTTDLQLIKTNIKYIWINNPKQIQMQIQTKYEMEFKQIQMNAGNKYKTKYKANKIKIQAKYEK